MLSDSICAIFWIKKVFDQKGLIYGMGHAVYSISDPRADIFKKFVKQLAVEKGFEKEYALYEMVEHMAPEIIGEKRRIYKGVNANVDFLQRTCIQHAGTSKCSLYADLCGGAYCRMERASSGRAEKCR
mgnify:CR=1 FL=1